MTVTVTLTCRCSAGQWWSVETSGPYEDYSQVRDRAEAARDRHAIELHPGQSRLRRWWRQRRRPGLLYAGPYGEAGR